MVPKNDESSKHEPNSGDSKRQKKADELNIDDLIKTSRIIDE